MQVYCTETLQFCTKHSKHNMETLTIILVSILFGVTQKLADALNEHKTVLFKGANILFGCFFGLSGYVLCIQNKAFSLFFFSLLVYWMLNNKLDYLNHRISATIMLFAIAFHTTLDLYDIIHCVFLILIMCLLKVAKNLFKRFKRVDFVFKNRFQHLILAFLAGYYLDDAHITISISLSLISIILTINVLKNNKNYMEIV